MRDGKKLSCSGLLGAGGFVIGVIFLLGMCGKSTDDNPNRNVPVTPTIATTKAVTTAGITAETTTARPTSEGATETSTSEDNSGTETGEESKEPEIIWLDKSLGLYQSTTETKGVIDDYGYITIYGGVGNASKTDYSYVEIVYSIYDDAGNKTGDAIDNIMGLKSGERWRYEAFGYAANGSKYKFKSVTAF